MSSDGDHGKGGLPGMAFVESLIHGSHNEAGYHLTARPLITAFIAAMFAFLLFVPGQTFRNFGLLLFLAPLWVPAVLVYFGILRFVQSRRAEFIKNQKHVLLELRLPRDTKKTPLAMEMVFANLHLGPGEGTWYKKYWRGGVRPWWSFEVVSLGGRVHFYVWTREGLRRGLESYFYAQYPGIEIIEAEDYSKLIDPAGHDYDMFGAEFVHTQPDPIPMKTYVDHGLDRAGTKPEEQMDPLSQLIELMGSLGPKEQLWLQLIVRMTKKEKYDGEKDWKAVGKEEVEKIRKEATTQSEYVDPVTHEKKKSQGFPNPTKGQIDKIAAIERNIGKQGFDVGIRSIYTAPKDAYQGSMITYQLGMLKPFSSESHNGFKPASLFSAKFQDYPWEDRHGHHKHHEHQSLVNFYRRRAYFHDPYVGPWVILSTEELATIFHVPSSTVETPSLPRIQSATGGAPGNLPI